MRIRNTIPIALAAVLSPLSVSGQVSSAAEELREEEKTVQIVLYPAAEPRPALKYQLLPPLMERRPGNAAVWWNRVPAAYQGYFNTFFQQDGAWDRIEKWMEIPLGDPREKELRETEIAKDLRQLRYGPFSDMERAARFESCDWQWPIREGNFIAMHLPDADQTRRYARLLMAKARLEIAEGNYDQAVQTLQTGFAMARHVSEGATLVGGLCGVTDALWMYAQVEQWIQRPDGPNLYWALSTLPRPLVSLRAGGEAESNILYLQFPDLYGLDKKQLSPEGWRDLLAKTAAELPKVSRSPATATSLKVTISAIQGYSKAKRYLIENGRSAEEVEAMPVAQVVLLYTVQLYDELSDEQFKWFYLPMAEAGNGPARAWRVLADAGSREILPFATEFVPFSQSAKMAETRLDWRLGMLRVFEAMRLYAANHDGRWPDQLSDITEVPIPRNPIDDKPFIYQRHGNKAVVTCEKGPRGAPWRHEVTLMTKGK